MNTIHVNAAEPYNVFIQDELLTELGTHLASIKQPCPAVIVTDDMVAEHYLTRVSEQLHNAGYTVSHYIFPHGESSKNVEELVNLVEFLADHRLSRSDLLVALGGGVVGDMAGFAAATYLRGIDYVQIPTSLLAMVDSSVGGKTAVNLKAGKNLWGAFKQPLAVFCDPTTLQTLPKKEFINGCGEIIKYGMIGDPTLLEILEKQPLTEHAELIPTILQRCIQAKSNVVEKDEREGGIRQLLNFGHTFAHGIEILSHFEVHHGYAVAIGMALMARGAVKTGQLDQTVADRLCDIIKAHQLPTTTDKNADDLINAARHDKKSHGHIINIIVPVRWGHSHIKRVTYDELRTYLD